eukprot:4158147-Pleurochrysis_carterae.AAC.3
MACDKPLKWRAIDDTASSIRVLAKISAAGREEARRHSHAGVHTTYESLLSLHRGMSRAANIIVPLPRQVGCRRVCCAT